MFFNSFSRLFGRECEKIQNKFNFYFVSQFISRYCNNSYMTMCFQFGRYHSIPARSVLNVEYCHSVNNKQNDKTSEKQDKKQQNKKEQNYNGRENIYQRHVGNIKIVILWFTSKFWHKNKLHSFTFLSLYTFLALYDWGW